MIQVTQMPDDDRADFVFEVEVLKSHEYTVWFSEDYYQKLTHSTGSGQAGRSISPEELVRKSFEFLLDREPPSAILPQFDLAQISHYFPEYEDTIEGRE